MKNKILIFMISLILLTGCKKANAPTQKPKNENIVKNTADIADIKEDKNENLPQITENPTADPKEDIEDENNTTPKNSDLKKELVSLIDKSDYVSIIKLTNTGADGKELHVLEDLKGSIKNIVLPEFKNIEPNKNYIIFLMDSASGEIVLTDAAKGLMYITGDEDENAKIVREYLAPETDENTEPQDLLNENTEAENN